MSIRSVFLFLAILLLLAPRGFALISVGILEKKEAEELGITMHSHKNGDAGVKVWLKFKKEGFLKAFTYAELRMRDSKGKHLVSARLDPHPVNRGQLDDIVTVAFSAAPGQLKNCSFMIVAYGSTRGDVGYLLKVTDFIDL